MTRALLDERDATERLSPDDMATLHETQLREAALLEQRLAAEKHRSTPGICSNCGEACLPAAVYCDADCRHDHERRLRAQRLAGGSR